MQWCVYPCMHNIRTCGNQTYCSLHVLTLGEGRKDSQYQQKSQLLCHHFLQFVASKRKSRLTFKVRHILSILIKLNALAGWLMFKQSFHCSDISVRHLSNCFVSMYLYKKLSPYQMGVQILYCGYLYWVSTTPKVIKRPHTEGGLVIKSPQSCVAGEQWTGKRVASYSQLFTHNQQSLSTSYR